MGCEFIGKVIHETELAILFLEETMEKEEEAIWLPKSLVTCDESLEVGEKVEVTIPEWLAIEKEMV